MHYAFWIAVAGGSLTAVMTGVVLVTGGLDLQATLYMSMAIGMQFLMAHQIKDRHEFAAGSMVVGYALSLAWRWFHEGQFPGIVAFGFLAMYVRAFLAAIELTELDDVYGAEATLG